jgi:DNA-binding CsgD family transcriptional regulator
MYSRATLHALTEISRFAAGLAQVADYCQHAYQLGVKPGRDKPGTLQFHRQAVAISLATCPERYVRQVGIWSAGYATQMRKHHPVDPPEAEWELLIAIAENMASAVDEHFFGVEPVGSEPSRTGVGAPGQIRYDRLAALMSRKASAHMGAAAATVRDCCHRATLGSVSEVDIEWLHALARGERTADIALAQGRSERDLYRQLRQLYRRLGVENRAGAIWMASRMGWLEEAD